MHPRQTRILLWSAAAVVALACLSLVYQIYTSGNAVLAAAVAGIMALGFFIYTAPRAYTLRYLFPGLAGIGLFVLLPLLYTTWIGFTNYGSKNLLTFARATEVLLEETYQREGAAFEFSLHSAGAGFRIVLTADEEEAAAPPPSETGGGEGGL